MIEYSFVFHNDKRSPFFNLLYHFVSLHRSEKEESYFVTMRYLPFTKMATDIPLGLSKAFRWVPHKFCDIIGCNHNHITKPTKTQIRTHLQKVCVRIFQYGAQLATGSREANASACVTHEPAPKGMVQPLFRPIRPWRDLRSKNGPLHRFARRHAGRHIRIMGKGMKVRAVPILPATAKNEKSPQPTGNWLRGN